MFETRLFPRPLSVEINGPAAAVPKTCKLMPAAGLLSMDLLAVVTDRPHCRTRSLMLDLGPLGSENPFTLLKFDVKPVWRNQAMTVSIRK